MAVAVLSLVFFLSLHLVVMAVHGMAMMIGLCFAVLAGAAVSIVRGPAVAVAVADAPGPRPAPERRQVVPIGRHPPGEGIRLRS